MKVSSMLPADTSFSPQMHWNLQFKKKRKEKKESTLVPGTTKSCESSRMTGPGTAR
jgi:hypothetical protein